MFEAPKPQNKELQSYLGLYRSFLPEHLQPLRLLIRDSQQWAWKEEQDLVLQCWYILNGPNLSPLP